MTGILTNTSFKGRILLRWVSIFLAHVVLLWLGMRAIGVHFYEAAFWLTSPAACIGYVVVFGPLIGLSITCSLVASIYSIWVPRTATLWCFLLAFFVLFAMVGTHMKMPTCF